MAKCAINFLAIFYLYCSHSFAISLQLGRLALLKFSLSLSHMRVETWKPKRKSVKKKIKE